MKIKGIRMKWLKVEQLCGELEVGGLARPISHSSLNILYVSQKLCKMLRQSVNQLHDMVKESYIRYYVTGTHLRLRFSSHVYFEICIATQYYDRLIIVF